MTISSGGASLSSSITTLASTGSHVLKINGYSTGKQVVKNGCSIDSCEFEAAGHTWCICYYPNGRTRDAADHIGLFLKPIWDAGAKVTIINARFRFILLPHRTPPPGKKPTATPYSDSFISAEFRRRVESEQPSFSYGVPSFIKREVLEKSEYLSDDCFVIRCDIAVVETSAAKMAAADPNPIDTPRLLGDCNKQQRRRRTSNSKHDGGGGAACSWCTDILCNCDCYEAKQQRRRRRGFKGALYRLLLCLARTC